MPGLFGLKTLWRQSPVVERAQLVSRIAANALEGLIELNIAPLHVGERDTQRRQFKQAAQLFIARRLSQRAFGNIQNQTDDRRPALELHVATMHFNIDAAAIFAQPNKAVAYLQHIAFGTTPDIISHRFPVFRRDQLTDHHLVNDVNRRGITEDIGEALIHITQVAILDEINSGKRLVDKTVQPSFGSGDIDIRLRLCSIRFLSHTLIFFPAEVKPSSSDLWLRIGNSNARGEVWHWLVQQNVLDYQEFESPNHVIGETLCRQIPVRRDFNTRGVGLDWRPDRPAVNIRPCTRAHPDRGAVFMNNRPLAQVTKGQAAIN